MNPQGSSTVPTAGTQTQLFDVQDHSFGNERRAAPRTHCSRLVSASLRCALYPCTGVLRRCGWLPPLAAGTDSDEDDGATAAQEWVPDVHADDILFLDNVAPAPLSVHVNATASDTPALRDVTSSNTGPSAGSGGGSGTGRGYTAPRARPEQLRSTGNVDPVNDSLVRGVDAPSSSSLLETEPSSTLSSAHPSSMAERWVMQRGVLVKVGPDGLCTTADVTSPMNSRTRGRPPRHLANGGGVGLGTGFTASPPVADGSHSRRSAAADAIVEQLDGLRQPISGLSDLTAILERCCRHLPFRLEVALDHAAVAQTHDGTLAFGLHILGPLPRLSEAQGLCAEVLTVVEDILLDDCQEESLRLSCLHLCDLTLTADTDTLTLDGGLATQELGSNAFLDTLLSPTSGPQYRSPTGRHAGHAQADNGEAGLSPGEKLAAFSQLCREFNSRLQVLLKNVLESRARDVVTLRLTRCVLSPLSIGDFLAPCLPHIRRLLIEQCPLSDAHVDALLQFAHRFTQQHQSSRGSPAALSRLQELQLCGALSPDAVQEVLRYFAEEVPWEGAPCLRTLRLPFALARIAREHPFVVANPSVKIEVSS